jgi:hypothetical protein
VDAHDRVKTRERAIVTGWTPDDLQRKLEVEARLIESGLVGMELEQRARELLALSGHRPLHEVDVEHNTLVTVGLQLWEDLLIGAGGTVFNNANAALGVGDSAAAFAVGQTNLQGAVNVTDRLRKAMDATFPSRTGNVITFRSTFATGEVNFVWNEWAFFNNVTDGSGTMLNRAVTNLGTKTSASAWQLTATETLS